ncbi:MAG: 50S ribosomal protein L15 [Patescibacteria group bacterium]|jgi:large subunit ribosomal protein L15
MSLALHKIKSSVGAKKGKKRIGRGLGSTGSYSGRGVKGQRARSGGRSGLQLKGLRSLMLKLPKQRGFQGLKDKPVVINLQILAKHFSESATITPKILLAKGLISKLEGGVKILGQGEIKHRLVIKGCHVSKPAEEKIIKAGGEIIAA